jgi:hypothetical protein
VAKLTAKARRMGLTPQRYIQQLIEEDLALDQKAKSTTFAQIMGPGSTIDEAVLDKVVDEARTRHHANGRRKR